MCGIAAIFSPYNSLEKKERVQLMLQTLTHRGPNGEGIWENEDNTVCLGHRRLAILDTSIKAAQPFNYLHYYITYNGEIYNYIELKEQLQQQGYEFTTTSDTEVIPAAFDYWGKDCLQHFDGMFAFALYDAKTEEVFVARDRFGEKPLYYYADYQQRGKFNQLIIASEMKALWKIGVSKQLNGTMVLNYVTLGFTQNPIKKTQTFYSQILSLPASHYLSIQPKQGRVQMNRWYTLTGNTETISQKSESDLINQFQELLQTSVNRRLRSHVQVGCSLSGGLDSTAITSNILQNNHTALHSFSAVFPGFAKDESNYIQAFQQHHQNTIFHSHFITPTETELYEQWHQLMYHQEEPIQSSSVFTQFMVYQLAKKNGVTVLLDGQGADEILGGYTKYTPWYLQHLLKNNYSNYKKEKQLLIQNEFLQNWNYKNYAAAFFPEKAAIQLHKKAIQQQLHHPHLAIDFYRKYYNDDTLQKPIIHTLTDLLRYNTTTHGLEELLRYADKNAMAASTEVRLPFLNHQLVEFAFGLPDNYKIRNGFTKWILRKASEHQLPKSICWRKGKIGYEPPQAKWMQSSVMIEMIHSAKQKLVQQQILQPSCLEESIQPSAAHAANNYDWRYLSVAAIL
ncbi:MAG: asparagine synthase (glutamine-hydrolyzing) [Chitinophagaceae bacterium]